MATEPLGADSAHVITPNQFPPAAAGRIAARMLDRFNRDELGNAIEVLVELLDAWDGDADVELNGDELDGTAAEDDYGHNGDWRGGAGCVISDPDAAADDVGCDDNEMDLDEGYFDHPGRIPGGGSDDC